MTIFPNISVTPLRLTTAGLTISLTLGEFIRDNEFSDEEQEAIVEDILTKGIHKGGGGASPEWAVHSLNELIDA